MTITLQPEQERAIQAAISRGDFRSVDEFIDAAIATLANAAAECEQHHQRKSRLWELRQGLSLGDISIKELIEQGRE
jgi:Arc/MetJ-type ribon-helix-helix transcriptional regulator